MRTIEDDVWEDAHQPLTGTGTGMRMLDLVGTGHNCAGNKYITALRLVNAMAVIVRRVAFAHAGRDDINDVALACREFLDKRGEKL